MTKKVCLYCRVSTTDRQDVNRQVNELKEVVDNNGWILTDIYIDEGFSRSTTTRPELDRMMKDSFSRKFEMVMTLELSRLGSNLKHMIETVETLKSRNTHLWIKNQQIDTSSITGMMFFSILTSISNYERELISERVKSGLENCKRKGIRLGRPSNLTLEKENEIKTLYSKKMGLNKISKEVNVGVRLIKKVLKSCIVEQV
jgi:DNA invertase Pin-like site-specific DNA recombinase